MTAKHENALPQSNIIKLFENSICDPTYSLRYINRLLLAIAIFLGSRPISRNLLPLPQF